LPRRSRWRVGHRPKPKPFTFLYFGFPTETIEDAQQTVNFLYAHQAAVHSASFGAFALECYAPVEQDPAKFGVRRVFADPARRSSKVSGRIATLAWGRLPCSTATKSTSCGLTSRSNYAYLYASWSVQ